jgi:uncharacterized protein (UPF0548 family)
MPTLRRPTEGAISRFLLQERRDEFSYQEVGCTRLEVAAWELALKYFIDRHRICLGRGRTVFEAACLALRNWEMFHVDWAELHPIAAPIEQGEQVAVVIRSLGLWWTNGARIVYVDDRRSSPREFAFAYGTLQAHSEQGEERFSVHWSQDDSVWYELTAMSRPGHWYTWLGLPLVRGLQRRFAADSQRAMYRAVQDLLSK